MEILKETGLWRTRTRKRSRILKREVNQKIQVHTTIEIQALSMNEQYRELGRLNNNGWLRLPKCRVTEDIDSDQELN